MPHQPETPLFTTTGGTTYFIYTEPHSGTRVTRVGQIIGVKVRALVVTKGRTPSSLLRLLVRTPYNRPYSCEVPARVKRTSGQRLIETTCFFAKIHTKSCNRAQSARVLEEKNDYLVVLYSSQRYCIWPSELALDVRSETKL